nr:MAG TPA: DNA directed DNA polymerase [Caudoviricetes sp.]
MSYEYRQSDVFDFAHAIGADVRQKGNELFFRQCPRCRGGKSRDRDTFSVNLETGAFKCFRAGCDYHGHFVELARDFGYKLDMGEQKTYRRLPQREIEIRPSAVKYLEKRGISRGVTERYKITAQRGNPNILVFPFYDENNILQFVKYRNSKYSGYGNKEWCEKDTKPILFGMAQCTDFGTLLITEGQIDSLSAAECGISNAVSVPTGALGFTWLKNCWEWITKFQDVIVFGDWEKGKMTLLDTLTARLPQKVRGVRPEDYLGEKDANDILRKFGKQAVITAVNNAEAPKISNVKRLADVKAVNLNGLPKLKTNIREIDRVIGGLVMGQVILLTGKRGEGKSTFMSQLVCEALEQDAGVFIYSGELPDFHFKAWLNYQLAGAENIRECCNEYGDAEYFIPDETARKISDWYSDKAYIYDNAYLPRDGEELASLPETVENVIKQYGVKLVCIDNLMTAMDAVTQNDNLYLAQSNFVGALKKIAMRYDVAILLVAHPRKTRDGFSNDDVSGSSDITNKADVVLSYERIEHDDYESKLLITKNRLTGRLALKDKAVMLNYAPSTKRIYGDSAVPRHYGWERLSGAAYADANELPF